MLKKTRKPCVFFFMYRKMYRYRGNGTNKSYRARDAVMGLTVARLRPVLG